TLWIMSPPAKPEQWNISILQVVRFWPRKPGLRPPASIAHSLQT
ncbi:uncharacterized protein METZ01_LOCUS145485, partial [marine metagenome]